MTDPTKYTFSDQGFTRADLNDVFIRKEFFSDGGLWLWGSNFNGMMGNNTSGSDFSSPIQTIAGGSNWIKVAASNGHSASIKTDGTLWLWGAAAGIGGTLGDNTTVSKSSPVQTIASGNNWTMVSVAEHSTALKSDGTLWIWGGNSAGQIGDNTTISKSSPVQTITGGSNWKFIDAARLFPRIAAIKTDGTLWLWGNNQEGRLGINSTINQSSPVQTISGGTNWKCITADFRSSTAIKTDGTLWLWGNNFGGDLGNNNTVNNSSPVQTVTGGSNWSKISVSSGIKTDGTLWIWGTGGDGSLGTNSTVNQSSPVQTVSGGTNWKTISGTSSHRLGLKTDGTLWLWGRNQYGRLGDNTAVFKSSPVQTITGGTNWTKAEAFARSTMTIREGRW